MIDISKVCTTIEQYMIEDIKTYKEQGVTDYDIYKVGYIAFYDVTLGMVYNTEIQNDIQGSTVEQKHSAIMQGFKCIINLDEIINRVKEELE